MQNKEISRILLKKKALKFNMDQPFVWTSGMLSPIYVDNRILISYPKERDLIIKRLTSLLSDHLSSDTLTIAGTATAAIPWAAFLAYYLKLPMVYVRPKPKQHGERNQVEGRMPKNSDVIVIEDLISTGGSSLGSARALRKEYEARILGVVAIFSYVLPESVKSFKEEGIPLDYLTDFETTVDVAIEEKYLSEDDKVDVLRWREERGNWGKKMGFVKQV
jgi:orotate phosphoribosyltransferase